MISWTAIKEQIPHRSGVYIFKDANGEVMYVGKAIDLFHRVASYFARQAGVRLSRLRSAIAEVATIVVESELEALILEANLIKKYLPKFNSRLTDDKDYLYIGITKEAFPKVITLRKHDLKNAKKYFGPFPSSRTVRDTLKQLRKVFPWCQAGSLDVRKQRACFYFHLKLCPGACVGLIGKEDYQKIISRLSLLLEGKKNQLLEELMDEMKKASDEQKYEQALQIKKVIEGINYLTQANRTKVYLENPNFLEEENKLALQNLKDRLKLPSLPNRIEAYDISNIQGQDATGSLVVLTDGEIDKSEYRRFKIMITGRPNDVGMHKEMMRRRIKHPEWPKPDLILIDGGRGQVNGVLSVIKGSAYENIPLFGLAKRLEWLYPPTGEIIKLPRKSLSLKLLQKIRDEAHRFAISYHRKLYKKSMFGMVY